MFVYIPFIYHMPCSTIHLIYQVWGAGDVTATSWYNDHKCQTLQDVARLPNLTSQQVCGLGDVWVLGCVCVLGDV